MPGKDKTVQGVFGVILAVGGLIGAIAYANFQQTFFVIIFGVIAIIGVLLIAGAVSD